MAEYPIDPRRFALCRAIAGLGWRGTLLGFDRRAPAIGAAFLLLAIPVFYAAGLLDLAQVNQLGRYCAIALVAIGLDLVWGYTGMLSLCQAMFFTLGGYAMGMHLAMQGPKDGKGVPTSISYVSSEVGGLALPWFWQPFAHEWFTILAVMAVPAIVAGLFGWLAFRSRIKGVYFSIITQALTIALMTLFSLNLLKLGGTNGLTNFTHLLGFDIRTDEAKLILYWVSALTLIGTALFAWWLTTTRFGRILVAVRDSEARLRFAGYQPVIFKTAVFTLAAVLAGIGGALYVPQTGIVTPSDMAAVPSIMVVVWVALGGRGTITGAVIGALLVNLIYALLTTHLPKFWPFILGAVFVSVVLFMPDGIVGQWRKFVAWAQRGKASA
jgi:urea transport system permease protein